MRLISDPIVSLSSHKKEDDFSSNRWHKEKEQKSHSKGEWVEGIYFSHRAPVGSRRDLMLRNDYDNLEEDDFCMENDERFRPR